MFIYMFYLQMFILYNNIQSKLSYLVQFKTKFIWGYLTGSDTLMMPDACKNWDDA